MAIDWETVKKKAKEKDKKRVTTGVNTTAFDDIAPIRTTTTLKDDDIAPVRPVTTVSSKKEKERTWFKKSEYFADGKWNKGDLTKTILGSLTDVGENLGTGIIGMGEKAVDALAMVGNAMSGQALNQAAQDEMIYNVVTGKNADNVLGNYQAAQREVTKGTVEFVKKDLYNEEAVAKKIISAPVKEFTGVDSETDSVFGEKSDALVQSGGQLLGTAGLQAIGIPWYLTTGATAFGSQSEEALKEGATYEETMLSSAVSAGAEILTEKLSGGIKFGGKTLDDVLTKPLLEKISNKAVKALVNIGLDATGEGAEEVISGVMSNLGTALYKEEDLSEILASEEALDEYLESFIGGAVLGGGSSAVTQVANRKAVELTENEQKVFDKEVENRIAEVEKDGKKVTKKEESAIRQAVLNDLLKGYISIDTIESTLGGETYDSYKSVTEQEENLQNEFKTLNQMKQGEMTGEQIDRRAELKQQLEEVKNNSNRTQIKEQLSNEVFELAKDSRLAESYNEKSRRGQSFEADLSKYDAKQQEVIKKAVESGILNNTNRAHEFVDMIAKISADKGVLFDFVNNEKLKTSGFAVEGKTVNGYKTDDGNIALNIDSSKALNSVVGHEITHILEGTELYSALQEVVKQYATTKGEYAARMKSLRGLYTGVYKGTDFDAKLQAELTADIVGDYLFSDSDFINSLSTEQPNLFKKIYNEIKYLYKVATAGSKEARELEKVKRAFEQAYKDSGTAQKGTQYDVDNNQNLVYNTDRGEQYARTDEFRNLQAESQGMSYEDTQAYWSGSRKIDDEVRGRLSRTFGLELRPTNSKRVLSIRTLLNPKTNNTVNIVEGVDASLFHDVFEISRKYLRNGELVDLHDIETTEDHGIGYKYCDNYLSEDGLSGFSITPDGDLISVFNLNTERGFLKTIAPIVKEKAKTLDCYASENQNLMVMYEKIFGFKTASVMDYNMEYDHDNIAENHNEPKVAFMVNTESDVELRNFTKDEYNEAVEYRNSFINQAGSNGSAFSNAEKTKYSLSDSEGKDLSIKQSEYFKNSKIRDANGDLKVMYHGSHKNFTVFDKNKARSGGTYGKGFYFTDSKSHAGTYGDSYVVYLNITNPLQNGTNDITKDQLRKFVEALAENEDYGIENYGYEATIDSVVDSVYGKSDFGMLMDLNITCIGDMVEAVELFNEVNGTDYNGIVAPTETVAFFPEQIKDINNKAPTDNPDIRYSLSKQGEHPIKNGNYHITGEDIRYKEDIAPTVSETEKVAPVGVAKNAITTFDEYAPMTEEEANAMLNEQNNIATLTDADAPPEIDAPMYDIDEYVPESPLEDRDMAEVGSKKVKAYMYENPEVKPFFQEMAQGMLVDLHNTVKGERTYNSQLHYDSGGELGWMGTKRHTSPEIANLLDNWKYSYKQIEDGLNAIIEDNGAENNAVSKRIEFALDEMLREGYTDFFYGVEVPPNQDYINLLRDKEITEYNDKAFNYWLSTLTEEDYKPIEAPIETAQEEIAPTRAFETIKPKPETLTIQEEQWAKNKMARADKVNAEQPSAKILTEETKADKKKSPLWSKIKTNFIDKALPFETLSLKTGNREVDAKFNSIRYADSKAQTLIGEGAEGVKSLNDIQAEVESDGLTQSLYEYLYHKHNVDRMTLADRYDDVPNKAVFGDNVTAKESQEIVNQYEFAEPKLKEYAQEIYNYNKHLRGLLVDGGVISQETADLWEEMYPHYVPIRRVGDEGLNINVALDTGRTGVNAPIKRATGGNRDILPLFDTMAQRTLQTYKAIAKNRFGIELKNTLGTTIENTETSLDEVIDSIDTQDSLLQEGKDGKNPTFTVFENGEKVTFEITEEMYDAMKPTSEGLAYTNKVANTVSNAMRGVLTEYNPTFMLTNAIKDAQDVFINSQHSARTYKNFPKAIKELTTKGKWYTEYMQNGGADNTYFDKQTNSFNKEKSELSKIVGFPFEKISEANNFIERIPRLAEYIASREMGRSIDVSMLDSARVTTNFSAGGDVTKFLNRNGATFLNASVQGATQQVRNIREAKANGLKGWVQLASKVALAGLPALFLNGLLWDDDEEYEELSDYVKQNYYVVAKTQDGKFVRIPKGRTMAVIQEAFTQIQNALTGDDEVDLQSFLELAVSNLAPNNPLDNNIIAPIKQVIENKTWYGEDLVPTRLQDVPDAEQYDESTDAISKWLGEKLNVSPYKINYLLNQYSGGLGDVVLPMLTPEAESGDNSMSGFLGAPMRDKFTTDSVFNNQNTADFYNVSDELKVNANSSNATDEDVLKSKYFNSISTELGELYKEKREIQNSNLSDELKYKQVRDIQEKINGITENALNTYENVKINGKYANIGDRHYRLNDDGEWQKITDEQLEKQNEVIGILGITPSQYWGNKAEYDMKAFYPEKYKVLQEQGISVEDYKENYEESAFIYTDDYSWASDNLDKYTLSKAVTSDVAEYKKYTTDLYNIRADKDSNGKSISGSAKEKKIDYINNLNIDYGAKCILLKSEYPSDDTYNKDIVDYLNGRDDITFEEKKTILEELGATIDDKGYIRW